MADLQRDYIVTSNRESGFGRSDVMIELKKDDTLEYAIEQISTKPYSGKTKGLERNTRSV